MRPPLSRPCALFLALCLSLLLAGCASTLRLAYGQADTLLYWRLDSYLDFSSEQAPRVREGLAQFMSWHRRTQLPRYADELQRLRPLLAQPDLGAESICKAVDQLRATVETPLLDPANWPLLWMAGELSAEQLQHLERKQRVADEKWKAEWLDITPEQRRELRLKQAQERAEMLYGRLDEPQRAALREGLAQAQSFDPQRSYQERLLRQRELLQLLRRLQQERPEPELRARLLRDFVQRLVQGGPQEPARQRYLQALQREGCESFARLHRATTAAQRERAQRTLAGWEADFRQLAGG
jgi:hypothetical protein